MKNLRIPVFLIVFTFIFSTFQTSLQAVSTTNTITGVKKEKSTIGKKITTLFTKVKSKIQKVLNLNKDEVSLFWVWATLLILAGLLVGVILVFLAFLFAFTTTSVSAGPVTILLLLLAALIPIVSLNFAFRPLLRNHFRKVDKDVPKRKINQYAFLLSLVPGAIGLIWLAYLIIV